MNEVNAHALHGKHVAVPKAFQDRKEGAGKLGLLIRTRPESVPNPRGSLYPSVTRSETALAPYTYLDNSIPHVWTFAHLRATPKASQVLTWFLRATRQR